MTPMKTKRASKAIKAKSKKGVRNEPDPERFDSISAACAGMKLPRSSLLFAKKSGCDAFRNGRIYGTRLREWLATHPLPDPGDMSLEGAKLRRMIALAGMDELKLARQKGQLVEVSEVLAAMSRCCSEWNVVRVRFEQEWPVKLAGLDIPVCRTQVREMMDQIGGVLKGMGRNFED
jgi:hypothetical protein